jgi:2-C-methyl-D-erythritol 4-phosphate cytidylyltransferase
MRSAVVLLAAGSGRRAGVKTPKQFLLLGGEPLFVKAARTFAANKSTREIVCVSQPENHARIAARLRDIRFAGEWKIVAGGPYRGVSVRNGVRAVDSDPDVVLVHDCARPLVTGEIIRRVEQSAFRHGAALAAWPLPDTLKHTTRQGRVRKTIPRKNLWMAQTPQGFRWNVAQSCLLKPSPTATDDAELAERKGFPVYVVEGAAANFKVTYPADLQLCRLISR